MKIITLLLLPLLVVPVLAGGPPKKKSAAKTAVFTNLFNQANTDDNEYLDFEEFSNSYGAHPRPVITEYRYQVMSDLFWKSTRGFEVEIIGGISLEAFIEYNGGRKIVPSKNQIFFLADDNDDLNLTLSEFAATRVASAASQASTTRAFNKLDKDGNNLISAAEWGVTLDL
jgi:hypothetical protein